LSFSEHQVPEVRGLAMTCLGHIARIHKAIDLDKVMPVLTKQLSDSEIRGQVEDAIEDINHYVNHS
jgi:hypothetical protein